MVATNKGYVEEMDALLEGGADVNATHKVDIIIRKIGVVLSHLNIINMYTIIMHCGINFVVSSQGTGWTAIFFAAKNGSVELVQNLLHHKAKTELDVS